MDLLSNLLQHFSLNADVFFSGNLCGLHGFDDEDSCSGHLHLLKQGSLVVKDGKGYEKTLSEPSLIYFPRAHSHSLIADNGLGADLVCARIDYFGGQRSPIINALPSILEYPIESTGLLGQSARWVFDEAFAERSGKTLVLNRLCDIFIVNVLRKLLEEGVFKEGMMAGLANPQLAKVLVAIHAQPQDKWSLVKMAECCAMSRSKFSDLFKQVVGQTPLDYLTEWRITIAQNLIAKQQNMDLVAHQVGYENGSALARVFRKKIGCSPKAWLMASQSQA
ncbi:helix-turn-helix transcriptional regulator [Agaribacter flavus]|uniref:AraC family transcriptional regulator n=1 Tax=Agaribacter flavus TaxID=1902781 RepID=A0ABV7FNF5_9ALTE